ncbi:MAG: copper chaperone PCu(A)C [Alphaproteobacteria bacterium]|nr:copper chaperone PCu(A)C [Alphaproteobacteria bacterium]
MKTALMRLVPVALLAIACVAPAGAAEVQSGDIVITTPWARATPNGARTAAAYLTLENRGAAPDRLIGGTSEVAGKVDVHDMTMEDGVMKMRTLDGLTLEPGKTVTLAPGGMHLMFIDLNSPLKEGAQVKITLQFEKAPRLEVEFPIKAIGARDSGSADKGDHMHMDHDHH